MREDSAAHHAGNDGPLFEILTRSGRVAGPFSRAKLKQYASEKRLDPRLHIRKHDPRGDQPWRPCWKTKGLFPPAVVEACAREGETPPPAVQTATPEPEYETDQEVDWAFADAQASGVAGGVAQVEVPMGGGSQELGGIARIAPPPAVKKQKKAKRPGGASRRDWARIGGWMLRVPLLVHLLLAIIVAMGGGTGGAQSTALPGVGGVNMGMAVVVFLVTWIVLALLIAPALRLSMLIVRVPSPGYGELQGTGVYWSSLILFFMISTQIALAVSGADRAGGPAFALATSTLVLQLTAAVGLLMWRHAVGVLRSVAMVVLSFVFTLIIYFMVAFVLVLALTAVGVAIGR